MLAAGKAYSSAPVGRDRHAIVNFYHLSVHVHLFDSIRFYLPLH